MWAETKRVPLVSAIKEQVKALSDIMEKEGMKDDAILKGRLEELQRKMQKRQADTRYSVTLKHIGSADDPMKWDRMRAEYKQKLHELQVEARKKVMAEGGAEDIDRAIDAAVNRSPELYSALASYARQVVTEGVEGGEAEHNRLYSLGGAKLVLDALAEVRLFHDLDPEVGEA